MKYKKRFQDQQKQNAYMNACDCLYYGFGRDSWNRCGLSDDDACKVWKCAKNDLGRE